MTHRIQRAFWYSLTVAMLLLPATAHGALITTVDLNFNSLPSSQGFTYTILGNGLSETDVFSVDGTTLFQNSLAAGIQGQGENDYHMSNPLDPTALAFTLEVRARVLEENTSFGGHNHFGLALGLPGGGMFGLGNHSGSDGAVTLNPLDPTPEGPVIEDSVLLDTSIFHDYRFEGDLVNGTYQFFVDNVLRGGGPINMNSVYIVDLILGDSTGGANARSELQRYVFTQEVNSVPEPGALTLFAIGLIALGFGTYRKVA